MMPKFVRFLFLLAVLINSNSADENSKLKLSYVSVEETAQIMEHTYNETSQTFTLKTIRIEVALTVDINRNVEMFWIRGTNTGSVPITMSDPRYVIWHAQENLTTHSLFDYLVSTSKKTIRSFLQYQIIEPDEEQYPSFVLNSQYTDAVRDKVDSLSLYITMDENIHCSIENLDTLNVGRHYENGFSIYKVPSKVYDPVQNIELEFSATLSTSDNATFSNSDLESTWKGSLNGGEYHFESDNFSPIKGDEDNVKIDEIIHASDDKSHLLIQNKLNITDINIQGLYMYLTFEAKFSYFNFYTVSVVGTTRPGRYSYNYRNSQNRDVETLRCPWGRCRKYRTNWDDSLKYKVFKSCSTGSGFIDNIYDFRKQVGNFHKLDHLDELLNNVQYDDIRNYKYIIGTTQQKPQKCIRLAQNVRKGYEKYTLSKGVMEIDEDQMVAIPTGHHNYHMLYYIPLDGGDIQTDKYTYKFHDSYLKFQVVSYESAMVKITDVTTDPRKTKIVCQISGRPLPIYWKLLGEGPYGRECSPASKTCNVHQNNDTLRIEWTVYRRREQLSGQIFKCKAFSVFQDIVADTFIMDNDETFNNNWYSDIRLYSHGVEL